MKPSRIFSIAQSVILAFGIILIVSGFSHSASLRLEKYDGGIFTISKPELKSGIKEIEEDVNPMDGNRV